jgi:hypothetical protein
MMPLSRLVSYKHPCEMRAKNSGIALAVKAARDERVLLDG